MSAMSILIMMSVHKYDEFIEVIDTITIATNELLFENVFGLERSQVPDLVFRWVGAWPASMLLKLTVHTIHFLFGQ